MSTYPSKDIVDQAEGAARCRACAEEPRARIVAVAPDSPAFDAGFEPGCFITSVDGQPLRDLIDWRWLSADDEVELGYLDLDGDAGTVVLERELGEDWGLEFDGVVYDGVRQCRNACTFCFMRQLPDGMRPSLSLRDDDFRLSFLSGTFVTFTNLTAADEGRIIEQCISPLRVSLHAADAEARRRLIGKHAAHGLAALDRLLAAGVEFHAQIVLVPGENDGEVLTDTLEWAFVRPGILDVCIVPLGYTRHQSVFTTSFNDPAAARGVLDLVRPFQERALAERGEVWAYPADEFYRNAFGAQLLDNLPPTEFYGDFAMFEDGVGIVRSFVDDWEEAERTGLVARAADTLQTANLDVRYLVGQATRDFLTPLVARGLLTSHFEPLFVDNHFFGGNVDVTGLLCGCDMAAAIRAAEATRTAAAALNAHDTLPSPSALYLIPRVVFNDDAVTLDGMTLEDMGKRSGARVAVVSCNATDYLSEIIDLAGR
ncbi:MULTISPECIES: DUF512 domain-containing protein [Gordonibacter]|uniref:DUF512 domain-containing protein n=1 Tax=Gordonibacter faecis TaxID=3047475 RepID=A0ABT7DSX8_9ACTN|nr:MULTISPECIES: DUF512 domain-containing protein [unclassified Gordonibacter]MDJ1651708.1 DUF512 domain-containing protein [Gordonibacter sp. KGMB12511]